MRRADVPLPKGSQGPRPRARGPWRSTSTLQRLRAKSPKEIQLELETELDPTDPRDRDERAQRVLDLALRYVNTRGWAAVITDDNSAVRLTGGSVSLDISVGAALLRFIEGEGA